MYTVRVVEKDSTTYPGNKYRNVQIIVNNDEDSAYNFNFHYLSYRDLIYILRLLVHNLDVPGISLNDINFEVKEDV